jgi:hypothetical protein
MSGMNVDSKMGTMNGTLKNEMRESENQLIYGVLWYPRMVYKTTLPPISLDDGLLVEPTSWYPKPSIIGSYVPPTVTSDNAPYGQSAEAKIVYIHLRGGCMLFQ